MNTLEIGTDVSVDGHTGERSLWTKLLVDGQPLVPFEERWLAVDLARLVESLERDGEWFIVTCSCGMAECAGLRDGITVRRDSKNVHWTVRGLGPTRSLSFPREDYGAAVRSGVRDLQQKLASSGLETVPRHNAKVAEAQ